MPNHFHFLIQANEECCILGHEHHLPQLQLLSKKFGMVLSSYTQAINRQQNRRGKLFAHNTKAKSLNEEALSGSNRLAHNQPDYVTTCFLYIHQNPVMAGLVSMLENWEFSSYRDYAGLRKGKLLNTVIAREIIDLDFDNFSTQSKMILDDSILKKLFH